jgi:hypothetical protein
MRTWSLGWRGGLDIPSCPLCFDRRWVPPKRTDTFPVECRRCAVLHAGRSRNEVARMIGVEEHELRRVDELRAGPKTAAKVLAALLLVFPEAA